MAKSNRPPKASVRRAGKSYSLGGTLVTVLLLLLYWWLNSGAPTRTIPAGTEDDQRGAVAPTVVNTATGTTPIAASGDAVLTATLAVATTGVVTPTAAVAPTPTSAAPAATVEPTATATQPPRPKPSPTSASRAAPSGMPTISLSELPDEALTTLALIEQGGPFPFDRDGITFQNRERLLPQKPRGYYREYTVITTGESDRGARRIVAGENGELYYTDDHYDSFFWIVEE